jgi:hypothetical protein
MSTEPELTSEEIFQKNINELILALAANFDDKLAKLDEKMESYEKQIATLVIGFGEQAVFIEALLGQIQFSTEDAQKLFHETLSNSRKQMLQIMKEGSEDVLAKQDKRLAGTIADMADSKLSDSSE